MDYEKAYNDALERAKAGKPMDEVFPELKESEDERIRKEIVRFIKESPDMGALTTKRYEQWLAWLEKQKDEAQKQFTLGMQAGREEVLYEIEKQKEQKPLSTEETELNSIAFLAQLGYTCVPPGEEQKQEIISISEMVSKYRNADEYDDHGNHKGKPLNCMIRAYEQGIRDTLSKVKEQKPAEWSEEDKDKVDDICKLIEHATIIPRSGDDDTGIPPTRLNDKYKGELKAFVKSLRSRTITYTLDAPLCYDNDMNPVYPPINHWKPSEEQMWAVFDASERNDKLGSILLSLYNDLKKL